MAATRSLPAPLTARTCSLSTEFSEFSERVDAVLSAEVREKLGPDGLAGIKELVFLHQQGLVDVVAEDGEWSFYVAE